MEKVNQKLVIRVLLVALVIGIVLASGCVHIKTSTTKPQTQTQIVEDIAPEEAYTLIQKNKDNPNFVILDVRTPLKRSRVTLTAWIKIKPISYIAEVGVAAKWV
jgi:hypothetical protein